MLNAQSLSLGNCALCILQLEFAHQCMYVCGYVCACARAWRKNISRGEIYRNRFNKPVINLLFMVTIIFAIQKQHYERFNIKS